MKKFEFETSKGKFVLVDGYVENGIDLKQITEQQASEIVHNKHPISGGFVNYFESTSLITSYSCFSAIQSLHSLLKSKGVHLFKNPFLDFETLDPSAVYAEQNTFYNPHIFKL